MLPVREDPRDRGERAPEPEPPAPQDQAAHAAAQPELAAAIARTHGNAQLGRLLAGGVPAAPARRTLARLITADDAKKKIVGAGKGWGTDESTIYQAIRDCADRPGLQADPAAMKAIRSELSGHQLWRALFLLQYGPEGAWPRYAKEVFAATEGGGTDEGRIYRALQALSGPDAVTAGAIPALQELLRDELTGDDLKAAKDLLSGSYAAQIAQHKVDVAFVKGEIAAWKTSADPLTKNTAEWLEPAAPGTAKNQLNVLTTTHDSAARARAHGHKNEVAYFGDDVPYPSDAATYGAHIDSERGIHYAPPTVDGQHLGRRIWIMPQLAGAVRIREILVHEVQHDADRHDKEPGYGGSGADEAWNRYKTEFRAYYTDGSNAGSMVSGTATDVRFDNLRQQQVFNHLWSSPVYASWLGPAYNRNKKVGGRPFQDLVHGYMRPEGVNLTNSPRIDDLFNALSRCKPGHKSVADSPLKELKAAALALDPSDRTSIAGPEAKRLQDMLKDRLDPAVFSAITLAMNGGTAPPWATVNIGPIRRAIIAAGSGWGTDEQKIYDTFAKATPAERAEARADAVIQGVLSSELKGKELWRARQYLDHGPKANWPEAIRKQD